MRQTPQRFGGAWTLIKTDIVGRYMTFFNTALKNQPFTRIYIDAFAGSGAFQFVDDTPAQAAFPGMGGDKVVHEGSAARALRVDPSFDHIHFIEQMPRNVRALSSLIAESEHPGASVNQGDANIALRGLCQSIDWKRSRGVIFLDPYGLSVEWSTLETVAATKALDVWLLFPLSGVTRNLPRQQRKLDDSKRAAVTRLFGRDSWFEKFYSTPPGIQTALLPADSTARTRTATIDDIEAYYLEVLRTIFPHVEPPRRLTGPRNAQLFSLIFAVSNPDPRAIALARRPAAFLLNPA